MGQQQLVTGMSVQCYHKNYTNIKKNNLFLFCLLFVTIRFTTVDCLSRSDSRQQQEDNESSTNKKKRDRYRYEHSFLPLEEEYDIMKFDPETIFGAPYGGYSRATRSRLAKLPLRFVGGAGFDTLKQTTTSSPLLGLNYGDDNNEKATETLSSEQQEQQLASPYFTIRDGQGRQFVCRVYNEDELESTSVLESVFDEAIEKNELFMDDDDDDDDTATAQPKDSTRTVTTTTEKNVPDAITLKKILKDVKMRRSRQNKKEEYYYYYEDTDKEEVAGQEENSNNDDDENGNGAELSSDVLDSPQKKTTKTKAMVKQEPKTNIPENVKMALARLKGVCSQIHHGWWSYEWCHEGDVTQFHVEIKQNQLEEILKLSATTAAAAAAIVGGGAIGNPIGGGGGHKLLYEGLKLRSLTIVGSWSHRELIMEDSDKKKEKKESINKEDNDDKKNNDDTTIDVINDKDTISDKQEKEEKEKGEGIINREEKDEKQGNEKDDTVIIDANIIDERDGDNTKNNNKNNSNDEDKVPSIAVSTADTNEDSDQKKTVKILESFQDGQWCDEANVGRSIDVTIQCCEDDDEFTDMFLQMLDVRNKNFEGSGQGDVGKTEKRGGSRGGNSKRKKLKLFNNFDRKPQALLLRIEEMETCKYTAIVCTNVLCKDENGNFPISDDSSSSKSSGGDGGSKNQEGSVGKAVELSSQKTFEKDASIRDILDHVLGNKCLEIKDGWWSYGFCYKVNAYQYHENAMMDFAGTIKSVVEDKYALGVYDKESSESFPNEEEIHHIRKPGDDNDFAQHKRFGKDDNVKQEGEGEEEDEKEGKVGGGNNDGAYFVQEYAHGDICDESDVTDSTIKGGNVIDGDIKRSTTVQFSCGPDLEIKRINEDSTCHYVLVLTIPELCGHQYFEIPRLKSQVVKCLPVA